MITPKAARLTARDEREAYEIATLRDRDTCQRCRRDCGASERDHRQNRRAGNTVVVNLQILGSGCHKWKTEHPRLALAEGWAVSSYENPAAWPARRWVRSLTGRTLAWVIYTSDAGYFVISDAHAARIMEEGA